MQTLTSFIIRGKTITKHINHSRWLCRLVLVSSVLLFGLLQNSQAQNLHFNTTDQGVQYSDVAKNNPSSNQVYNQHWTTAQVMTINQANTQGVAANNAAPLKISLEQVRNGSGTSPLAAGAWSNGNLNASQAHYAEKWSIPYRLVISGLIAQSTNTVVIEWDIRQGGKNALDYITHYNNLDNPLGSHLSTFGHAPEPIDPKAGVAGPGLGEPSTWPIEPPTSNNSPVDGQPTASFNSLVSSNSQLGLISIWKGTITNTNYGPQGDLNAAASTQQLTIVFTANASTVVIAWGGHIASEADWGTDNSASAISGSPYHTRLISFNGSGGNQDRSLSADAVIDPPDCSLSGNNAVECNSQNVYTNLNEVPAGYTYTWSLSNNTSGASIVGAGADGKLSGVNPITVNAGSTACNGKGYTVNFTIYKNGAQIGAPCSINVAVNDDTDPVAPEPPADANYQCLDDVPAPGELTAVDNCSGDITVLGVDDVNNTNPCNITITRTWTFTDACNNTSSISQTITVADNTDPVAPEAPADASYQCLDDVPAPGELTAVDNCAGDITVLGVDDVNNTDPCNITITRTWTFTDDCNNTSSISQTITVADNTDPVAPEAPADASYQCIDEVPAPGELTATDNCSGDITVTGVDETNNTDPCNITITRTWTFTDDCDNTSSISQTITVADNTDPVAPDAPADASYQCLDDVPAPGELTAVDNCAGNITVLGVDDVDNTNPCNVIITRTWTFTDDCDNTSSISQTITVADNTDPVAPDAPADASYECLDDVPAPGELTATDNCSNDITVLGVDDVDNTNPCNVIITRTWTFTDDCNNTSSISQTITVADVSAPVITSCPPDVILECGSSSAPTADGSGIVTATDNCSTPTIEPEDVSTTVGCQTFITRTWTVTDDCGNTASCVQHIIIRDRTAPEITCPVNGGSATATDNCSAVENITIFYRDAGNVRTWTAIDESGNTATCEQQLVSLQANSNLGGQHLSNVMGTEKNSVTVTNNTVTNNTVTKMQSIQKEEDLKVTAFPNPFTDRVRFVVNTLEAGTGSLEVHNMLGQKVKTVFQGRFNAGTQNFELQLPGNQQSTLIYVLKINGKQVSGKMLQVK